MALKGSGVYGSGKVIKNLNVLQTRIKQSPREPIKQTMEQLKARVIEVTPLDKGNLRSTIRVYLPADNIGELLAGNMMGTGSPPKYVDYALEVHEMPANMNWTTPGTGPKYMEGPLKEISPSFYRRMYTTLRKMLRR